MTLKKFREEIDKVDNTLLKALSRRTKIVQKISGLKKQQHLPIINKKREQEIYLKLKKQAKKYHLDEKYLFRLYKIIIQYSRKIKK